MPFSYQAYQELIARECHGDFARLAKDINDFLDNHRRGRKETEPTRFSKHSLALLLLMPSLPAMAVLGSTSVDHALKVAHDYQRTQELAATGGRTLQAYANSRGHTDLVIWTSE